VRAADGRVLISAGEPSADGHGAAVARALLTLRPELILEGCGGPKMASAGVTFRCHLEQLSAIGFLEVAGSLPRHLRLLRSLLRDARAGRYRVAILIDYPGFHLRLGEGLRRAGVPVLWYIAPQLWAWAPRRLARLRGAADELALVLPFEAAWFRERGVPGSFVGHPVMDRAWPSRAAARAALRLPSHGPVLGIFPGSREGEIEPNWPLFRNIAHQLLSEGRCTRAVVAATPGGYYPLAGAVELHRGAPEAVLAAATAALVKSGSTTLEAVCTGTPTVVAYQSDRSTYAIATRLMTVDRIGLANLVAERDVVPEFWHLPLDQAAIAVALRPLLDEQSREHQAMLRDFHSVRERLGMPGAALRVAERALALG